METNKEKLTDERLVKLFNEGDEGAFEILFRRYDRIVKGLARTYGFFAEDYEDLWQVGFLGLYSAAKTYDETKENSSSFKTFAYSCIKYKILNAVKADPKGNVVSIDAAPTVFDDVSVEQEIIAAESRSELIVRIRSKLSPLEKKVFDLYVAGYKYTEIAEIIGLTAKAADNALQRIKDKSKAILKEKN